MDNFRRPPYLLACRRIEFIKKYTQLAQTSKAEELKLRLKMPARIRKLMTGKRLYLLGTMLVDLGFPDHDLLHNLGNGFKLSGWMPDSKLFPRRVPSLRFSVGHTDERTAELKQCLREIINNGELSTKEAERVMGRMISFDCYVFGRIANLDLKEFGNLCRLGLTSSILDECEISVVQKLFDRLGSAKPTPLGINNLSTWLIFTDGACEDSSTTGSIGGVLIAPNHRVVHHFGCNATVEVMHHLWLSSRHPIDEFEMIPVLVSFRLWGQLPVDIKSFIT